jgi:hypothetical protein
MGFSRISSCALNALYQCITFDYTLKNNEAVLLIPGFAYLHTAFASLLNVLLQTL